MPDGTQSTARRGECPGETIVLRFVGGELDPDRRREVEAHLDGCPTCLGVVAVLGRLDAPAPDFTPPEPGPQRYTLHDEIARGGMGRVVEAWDHVLQRRVAIKTVRSSDADGLLSRFRREMALTARLQHPAIIPIYDAGILEDGTPFYAMSMVQGRSLDASIDGCETTTERMALVPAVEQLVDAVAYAHAQRVIHRDLKPANVVIGPFGETVLLDWGLAKELDEPDPAQSVEDVAPDEEPAATRAGQVLGTPGYIAPEVARGETATERSDVYSLGVILARVLTGRRPQAHANEPPSLDAVGTDLPPDLVAIARRALCPDPNDRYEGARALSADLRRFAAGQLVAARRYTFVDRVARFASRHRAAVAVAAVAMIVLAVGAVVAVRGLVEAKDQAEAQRTRAQEQRQIAVSGREAAEGLIDFALDDLRGRLEVLGRLDLLEGVATEVEAYYERAEIRDGPGGVGDRLRRGQALDIAGRVRMDAGDLDGSLRAFQAASVAFSEAAQRGGGDEAGQRLSRSHLSRSIIHLRQGDNDKAREHAQRSHEIATDGVRANPDSPQWHDVLAYSLTSLGRVNRSDGRLDDAARAFERARDSVPAIRSHPEHPERADRIAIEVAIQLGEIARERGDLAAAAEQFATAVRVARAGAQRRPGDLVSIYELGFSLQNHGNALSDAQDLVGAEEAMTQALQRYEELELRDSSNVAWTSAASSARARLGHLRAVQGDLRGAVEHQRAALEASQRILDRDRSHVGARFNVAAEQANVADLERELGDFAGARPHYDAAIATFEGLIEQVPTEARYRAALAVAVTNRGLLQAQRGQYEAARESLQRARTLGPADEDLEALEAALRKHP